MNPNNQKQNQERRRRQNQYYHNQPYPPNYQNHWIQPPNYPNYQYYQYPPEYYYQMPQQQGNMQMPTQQINPVDPRRRPTKFNEKPQVKNEKREKSDHDYSSSQQSEDQEQLYLKKTKQISKKRDPILDSPEQIRKWIQARKKNYPSSKRSDCNKGMNSEISLLEKKIRQKLVFVSSDGKGLLKKLKNMDILKRIITNPQSQNRKNKRIRKLKKQKEEKKQVNKKQQKESSSDNQEAVEKPIKKEQKVQVVVIEEKERVVKGSGLQPEQMIKHLQEKQAEDREFYSKLMDYKSNSLNYKYAAQTLETNFVLQDIFQESCYLLQAIRFIAKNNFFEK